MYALIACAVLPGGVFRSGATPTGSQEDDQKTRAVKELDERIRPLFLKYCQDCHGAEKPKGNFQTGRLTADLADSANRERWLAVLQRVASGEMPPKGKSRPTEKEIQALTRWIKERAQAAEATRRAQGRVVLRRLNRLEYENTVRDLLGVHIHLQDLLPLDESAGLFDNVGDALHTSSFLME
jgi:mono/diheme cytochrome c family protein